VHVLNLHLTTADVVNSMSDIKWVEAWIDSCCGEYVLLVREHNGRIEIIDPQEKGSILECFASYEDALHWLNEDEYDLIEGRYVFEPRSID